MSRNKIKKVRYPLQTLWWEGNSFTLHFQEHTSGDFWIVVAFTALTDSLVLPGEYEGIPITRLYCHGQRVKGTCQYDAFPVVRTLILAASIHEIWLPSEVLPNLQEVCLEEGSPFSTDGRMLYRQDGKTLVLALARQDQQVVEVPSPVEVVLDQAFQRCPAPQILLHNKMTRFLPGKTPFRGSAWEKNHDALYAGDTLVYLNRSTKVFSLPANATQIGWDAFQTHGAKVLRVQNPKARLPLELFTERRVPRRVTFPHGSDTYMETMHLLYTLDQSTLVQAPEDWTIQAYTLPDNTRHVASNAFHGCTRLKKIFLPGVETIGAGAFARCCFLEEISIPDTVTALPDAPSPEEGVFAFCFRLSAERRVLKTMKYIGSFAFFQERLLPKSMKYIGSFAFFRAFRNGQALFIPESVEAVGPGSLWDVENLYVQEGTAKGLLAGMYRGVDIDTWGHTPNWRRMEIRGRDRHLVVYFPPYIDEEEYSYLKAAWEGERFDFVSFAKALAGRILGGEKEEVAENAVQLLTFLPQEEEALLLDVFLGWEMDIAMFFLEKRRVKAFSLLLRRIKLRVEEKERLLAYCNEKGGGYVQFAAIILTAYQEEGKSVFSL